MTGRGWAALALATFAVSSCGPTPEASDTSAPSTSVPQEALAYVAPPRSRAPTESEVSAAAVGKAKEELRALYGNPDVAGDYGDGRKYWTYWSPRLAVMDEDTQQLNSAGTIFKFSPDGLVYDVRF